MKPGTFVADTELRDFCRGQIAYFADLPLTSDYHPGFDEQFQQAKKGATVNSLEPKVAPPGVTLVKDRAGHMARYASDIMG